MAFPPGAVFGEGGIEIGEDTLIGQLVTISAGTLPGQDLCELTLLTIGDRCVIGRGSHIVAHESVEIGDDVWTGPYVYITDQNHGYEDPDTPIGSQFPVNRPVSIGAGSWLGAGAIILPGANIGRNVVVAAGSVVRGEVPDRCVVAGVPAKIVREHTKAGWRPSRAPGRKPSSGAGQLPLSAGPALSADARRRRGRSSVERSEAMAPSSRASPSVSAGGQRPGGQRRGQPGEPGGGLLDRGQQGSRSDTTRSCRSFRYRSTKTETFARSTQGSNGLEM